MRPVGLRLEYRYYHKSVNNIMIGLQENLRLALEVFHDIQKLVVDIGLPSKLDFDLIEVAQCVLTVLVIGPKLSRPHVSLH